MNWMYWQWTKSTKNISKMIQKKITENDTNSNQKDPNCIKNDTNNIKPVTKWNDKKWHNLSLFDIK